ncbi:hypothetical protein Ddye_005070 [Dipteronia dyeriana]|uniref:Uncharacterized protein n=1 Tax=Dipteronia dyeriana TaxID=168575 RepID=A0AAD9XFU8_9ROSI|nr:hypothetical protein Ddye_005070 [Dipteronia dyeriana]
MKAQFDPPLQDVVVADLPMEDQGTDDLYDVPLVLTIPILLDEMQSLEAILTDDMDIAFPISSSFTTFSISYAKAPNQPSGFDYGLFLYMFMDDNCLTPV